MEQYYKNSDTRTYAILLLFSFYIEKRDESKCLELLSEREGISYNFEVVKVLFKYYTARLADHEIRVKFFQLLRDNPRLEENENARFHYFSFIAECYNRNFRDAYEHLADIRSRYHHLNADFRMPAAKYILVFSKIDKWRWKLHLVSMWEQVVYFVHGMVGDLLKDAF